MIIAMTQLNEVEYNYIQNIDMYICVCIVSIQYCECADGVRCAIPSRCHGSSLYRNGQQL